MKIKFLTLNVFDGGVLFDNIIEFLKHESPDIAVFQEVYNGTDGSLPRELRTFQVLQTEFPEYHCLFAPEFCVIRSEGKIDIGNAIFSKFPLSNHQVTFFVKPYGGYDMIPADGDYSRDPTHIQTCTAHIGDAKVLIANTHGIWGLNGDKDTPDRLKMSETIVEQIKDHANVVLAGDFNVQPKTQTIKNIEKYLKKVFKDELATSFNLKHKDLKKFPGYASAVVDMMFVSPQIQVSDKYVPDIDVSDHLPLVAVLDI